MMETSTHSGTSPRGSVRVWETETGAPVSPTAAVPPPTYAPPPTTYTVNSYPPLLPVQQYLYPAVSPTAAYWAPETPPPSPCFFATGGGGAGGAGGDADALKAEAQRISKDAFAVGTQVYGGVKSAVASETTQGLFRSVGDMVAGAYEKLRGAAM